MKLHKIIWAKKNWDGIVIVTETFSSRYRMLKRFNELIKISNTVHTFTPSGKRGVWV